MHRVVITPLTRPLVGSSRISSCVSVTSSMPMETLRNDFAHSLLKIKSFHGHLQVCFWSCKDGGASEISEILKIRGSWDTASLVCHLYCSRSSPPPFSTAYLQCGAGTAAACWPSQVLNLQFLNWKNGHSRSEIKSKTSCSDRNMMKK
jgi:hypothetical protein